MKAQSLALSEAESLCPGSHGSSQQAIATALRSGWRATSAGRNPMYDLDLHFKDVGADHLVLNTRHIFQTSPMGRIRQFRCTVSDDGAGSNDVVEALMDRFHVPASYSDAEGALWVFVDDAGGRRFLPGLADNQIEELRAGRTVITFAGYRNGKRGFALLYREDVLATVYGAESN